jgi:hypothetical protein
MQWGQASARNAIGCQSRVMIDVPIVVDPAGWLPLLRAECNDAGAHHHSRDTTTEKNTSCPAAVACRESHPRPPLLAQRSGHPHTECRGANSARPCQSRRKGTLRWIFLDVVAESGYDFGTVESPAGGRGRRECTSTYGYEPAATRIVRRHSSVRLHWCLVRSIGYVLGE